jgi:hypothetical protein
VRELGRALQARGLRVWLDEWELVPERPWQAALEQIIQTARSVALMFGAANLGPWEEPEMRACLSEFVQRRLPVIPVLLPGAPREPRLPVFLQQFTWIDLRNGLTPEGLDGLQWGITGVRPGQEPTAAPTPTTPTAAASRPPASSGALTVWREKLNYLQEREAIAADPSQKFALRKQIEEAQGSRATPPSRHALAPGAIASNTAPGACRRLMVPPRKTLLPAPGPGRAIVFGAGRPAPSAPLLHPRPSSSAV